MLQASVLPLGQQEVLTDCAYDYYGLRLAVSGMDSKIKLLRMNETTGEWSMEIEWKAHDAPITRVSWAHPEHGSLVASSSFDRTVKIWQENNRNASAVQSLKWVERAVLTEAKGSVRSIEFAPSYFGLKLATLSTDSFLRIYECLEIYNASSWQLVEEIDIVSFGGSPTPLASVSTPTAVAMNIEEGSPPQQGIRGPGTPTFNGQARPSGGSREADSGWCLSWSKDKWWGEILAIAAGPSSTLKLVAFPPAPQRPILVAKLIPEENRGVVPLSITCVSWAPMAGRSYHLIATGSRDSFVRIWKLKPTNNFTQTFSGDEYKNQWTATCVGEFEDHKSAVGRLEWNVTGTVLSSAGDDGQVRFWKALSNVWRRVGSFNTHHEEDHSNTGTPREDDSMMIG
ncbi:hypothetical protein BS47DRAFT_1346982 [Hydnum rufescens UP504]|uniref:Uncharacterized protein n=1 Tax=Hydnum rufescens UP504 TaxID=1448309 RepID=A0A9P6AT79_9AGAM|nr:hypothetical protein BS47DRAFT_1346982 [Hydnum rufescens UP504]